MNKKITFPELIEAVAATTETSKRTSEMFLKELFAVISETLTKGENVKIKNLGQFKLTEVGERKSVNVNTGEEMQIPSHTRITFTPDKSLADAINMPFASFEAVEISDSVTEEELQSLVAIEPRVETIDTDMVAEIGEGATGYTPEVAINPQDEHTNVETAKAIVPENDGEKDNETDIVDDLVQEVPVMKQETEAELDADAADALGIKPESEEHNVDKEEDENCRNVYSQKNVETVDNPAQQEEEEIIPAEVPDKRLQHQDSYKNKFFWQGFSWGFVSMLIIAVAAFGVYYMHSRDSYTDNETFVVAQQQSSDDEAQSILDTDNEVDSVKLTDTIDTNISHAEPLIAEYTVEQHSDELVVRRDTVTRSRYLTTMARAYYGDFRFWVYIYEENKGKSRIGNPNAIPPGTSVIIPPASKYGIDKNDPASIERAKAKAVEIMKAYE